MDENRMRRFAWTGDAGNSLTLITNDTLRCRDCKFRTEPSVTECGIYEEKPGYVLDDARPCKYYEPKVE